MQGPRITVTPHSPEARVLEAILNRLSPRVEAMLAEKAAAGQLVTAQDYLTLLRADDVVLG